MNPCDIDIIFEDFPQWTSPTDVLMPIHQRHGILNQPDTTFEHLDTTRTWKCINTTQSAELIYWLQTFRRALEIVIKQDLLNDLSRAMCAINAPPIRQIMAGRWFGGVLIPVDIERLMDSMLDYQILEMRQCSWFDSSSEAHKKSMIINFLRTQPYWAPGEGKPLGDCIALDIQCVVMRTHFVTNPDGARRREERPLVNVIVRAQGDSVYTDGESNMYEFEQPILSKAYAGRYHLFQDLQTVDDCHLGISKPTASMRYYDGVIFEIQHRIKQKSTRGSDPRSEPPPTPQPTTRRKRLRHPLTNDNQHGEVSSSGLGPMLREVSLNSARVQGTRSDFEYAARQSHPELYMAMHGDGSFKHDPYYKVLQSGARVRLSSPERSLDASPTRAQMPRYDIDYMRHRTESVLSSDLGSGYAFSPARLRRHMTPNGSSSFEVEL